MSVFSAAALLTPAVLSAQFTTFVAPPRQAAVDSAKTTVAVTKARADSVARMSLADMKAWVDSAAGVPGTKVATANDTAMASVATAVPDQRVEPGRTTTTFSNGAIAPNTATPLPAYLVAGLASLVVGMLLLRLRARRA